MFTGANISTFMTWFVTSIINLCSEVFATMAGIEFAGTNFLRVMITITILSIIIPILLTVSKNNIRVGSARNEGKHK